MTNVLVALPIERLLEDIHFRTAIHPISFLGQLPERPWCLVVSGAGTPHNLRNKVAGALNKCRLTASDFGDPIPIELNVLEATSSPENWAASIEALAKAKFVVADVTNSEPAIMVLLGVRSVLRRGVTVSVSSGGAASIETAKPFNVRETRVLSSSHSDFIDRLSKVLVDGAIGLDADPNYLDLPAFLAARAPRPFDWANEDLRTILVLCPFAGPYSTLYDDELRSVINSWSGKDPVRMLDLRSPRLVGQSLYEQIRWSTHCLVDLSGWRPDVCFELGVRLACSDHEPLVIIQAPENNSPDAVGSEPPTLREIDGTENARGSKHLLDAELADTFGQVGGIEPRWAMASTDADQRSEHLERSKAAYDRGFELEQQLPRDAMEATSYNRINRLVARVLLQPQVLNGLNFDSVEVLGELHVAEDILNYRIRGSGQRDPWLYCDVGTINLLRGTDWLPTVQQLEKLRPPQFVYSSWLSTLTTINAVASSVRPELQDAIRLLERAARYAR